ncbi:hypothetical protein SAMN05661080_02584 [Modestobacter sp. DSM 44400]|uniref:hypothetical protein n=1 Tax=Modestobacter sp. DSM 44400 TaxID=1550230 RepID=UPI00089B5F2D|nr:hypothetical protein [Modestobacter sp. DSM 44400]SDY17862.1 hypothetical protein SAMN05661080_02584 [Modestobacter sp. DSM 44400]
MDSDVGLRMAAQRLTVLLAEPRYRRLWQVRSSVRRAELPRAAIAAVLAAHLFETGEVGVHHRARSLENRVGRALNGQRLSDRTLELFIAAFLLTTEHAEELRALRRGRTSGHRLVVATALAADQPMPRRTARTLQVAEHHEIGADRAPRMHLTRQLLEAVEATDRYHYAFDTPHAAVAVLAGGTPTTAFRVAGGPIHVVEIALTEPLLPGQTVHLEYQTVFAYPEPPAPEFRRGVSASVRHVALTVRFDQAALPREVLRGRWASVEATEPEETFAVQLVAGQASVELVPDGECVVGFTWRW